MRNLISTFLRGLRDGLKALYFGTRSVLDEFLDTIASPFRAIGGPGPDVPSARFRPDVEPSKLLDALDGARDKARARNAVSKDVMDIVTKFLNTSSAQRATLDLSVLRHDVRMALLDLGEHEVMTLRLAGPKAIRAFAAGTEHGVHGVPEVGSIKPATVADAGESPQERFARRIREGLRDPRSEPFMMPSMTMNL